MANDVLFPKLNSFRFHYKNEDVNGFEVFVTRYAKTMKSIDVDIDETCNQKSINILMTGLSQMSQLIDLRLRFKTNLTAGIPVLFNGLLACFLVYFFAAFVSTFTIK